MTRLAWWRDPAVEDKAAFLSEVPLFRHLDAGSRRVLAASLIERSFNASDLVFKSGEDGHALYIVRSGAVGLWRGEESGVRLDEVRSGGFFGEMALLDEGPRTATARCTEPSILYFLYKAEFDRLLNDRPGVAVPILSRLATLLSGRLRRVLLSQP